MTENIARHIATDPSSSPEERRQRRLFPGDGCWWYGESWRESPAVVDRVIRLAGTIAELLEAKAS